MNRIKLPTPPSRRRRDEKDAWRQMVATMFDEMIRDHRNRNHLEAHADVRRFVIEQVRDALNPDLSDEALVIETDQGPAVGIAGALRAILTTEGVDWRSAMTAEGTMAQVQAALDRHLKSTRHWRGPADLDPDDADKIRRCARSVAAIVWDRNGRKPLGRRQADRLEVLAEAREATGDNPHDAFLGPEDGGQRTATLAGIFRMLICEYDYHPPDVAAAILALAGSGVDEELAKPVPSERQPPGR